MKLYHYSIAPHKTLLSKRKSGTATPDEINKAEKNAVKYHELSPYVDHISLFFDPIPSSLIGKLFGGDHSTWVDGKVLYEHVVDTNVLDRDILYRVAESYKKTKFFDDFVIQNNWVDDDPDLLMKYILEEKRLMLLWGELGKGLPMLLRQIPLFQNKTTQAFRTAVKRNDFDENRMKYAANVPHLMVYPKSGKIRVESISVVTIGDDRRVPYSKPLQTTLTW